MICWNVLQTAAMALAVERNVMLNRAPSALLSALMDLWSGGKAAITGHHRLSGTPPVVANQIPAEIQLLMKAERVFATHTRVFEVGKLEREKLDTFLIEIQAVNILIA